MHFLARRFIVGLIRAGTSVGANTEEGEEGQSPKDEASKPCPAGLAGLGIAFKEVCERRYFLRLLKKRVGPQNNPDDLIQKTFELRNIMKSRIRKLRGEEWTAKSKEQKEKSKLECAGV